MQPLQYEAHATPADQIGLIDQAPAQRRDPRAVQAQIVGKDARLDDMGLKVHDPR